MDGNEYIDFNASSCITNIGHNHPKIVEAVNHQSQRLICYSPPFFHSRSVELAAALIKTVPGSTTKKALFTASESETIDVAIKLAKWHTRRHRFLAFIGASHGSTIGALSLSSNLKKLRYFFPLLDGVVHIPYPNCYRCPFKQELSSCNYWCVNFIEEYLLKNHIPSEEVAAIFFSPIQWIGGCIIPPREYFQKLKRLADKYNILLIDDETLTGMGRTGRWFGVEHWAIEPDVICVSGALASGLPLGAVVAKAELMDWEPNSHTSMFGGNPTAQAVALKVIATLKQENLIEKAAQTGHYFLKRLKELQKRYPVIGNVRGKGLMIGIEFDNKEGQKPSIRIARETALECYKRGVILHCIDSTLLISPPLSITRVLVDKGLELFEGSIAEANRE